MAKVKGPLLSLGVAGSLGETVSYARRRGVQYARSFAKPTDPRSAPQIQTRNVFTTANALWDGSPDLVKSVWRAFAERRVPSGLNRFVGSFIERTRGEADMLNMLLSPGVNLGPRPINLDVTPGGNKITIVFTNPGAPMGWTLLSAIAGTLRAGDPETTAFTEVSAAEDTVAQTTVVLSNLTGDEDYLVTGWLKWRTDRGRIAYSPSLPMVVATPTTAYTANAVRFDGVAARLDRDDDLNGASDVPQFSASMWFNLQGGDGVDMGLISNDDLGYLIRRGDANELTVILRSDLAGGLWRVNSTAAFSTASNPGWHHLLIGANFIASPVAKVYLDDSPLAVTTEFGPTAGDVDWTANNHFVGAVGDGSGLLNADLADPWYTKEYLDPDVLANRRKFIDAAGKPVFLGDDGELPTGTDAIAFFSGDTTGWHLNRGFGGGFTENGILTTAPTSPSD